MTTENITNSSDLIAATIILFCGLGTLCGLAYLIYLIGCNRIPPNPPPTNPPPTDDSIRLYGPISKPVEGKISNHRMNNLIWNHKISTNSKFCLDLNLREVIAAMTGDRGYRVHDTEPFFSDTANLIESFLEHSRKDTQFQITDTERYLFERIRDYYLSCAEYSQKLKKYRSIFYEADTAKKYADNGDYSAYMKEKDLRNQLYDMKISMGECPFIKRIHGYNPHI